MWRLTCFHTHAFSPARGGSWQAERTPKHTVHWQFEGFLIPLWWAQYQRFDSLTTVITFLILMLNNKLHNKLELHYQLRMLSFNNIFIEKLYVQNVRKSLTYCIYLHTLHIYIYYTTYTVNLYKDGWAFLWLSARPLSSVFQYYPLWRNSKPPRQELSVRCCCWRVRKPGMLIGPIGSAGRPTDFNDKMDVSSERLHAGLLGPALQSTAQTSVQQG